MAADKPDIHAIFDEAVARDSHAERARYLDEACGDDPKVRERVETLLRAHSEAGGFFGGQSPAAPATSEEPMTEGPGMTIGPYKLLQQIGEGGMGAVYMAEQTEPVKRRVALKVIKPGMDTRQVIGRFEAERHALAMMDHPNIARVLDAGTTGEVRGQKSEVRTEESTGRLLTSDLCPLSSGSGRPYFVMELVKGVPITQYCDEHQLTPKERLELFVPVCHAVQHAHQKGIIHRDIKPTNVLVAEYDDRPVPKIIDFGVAKAIEQRLTERTVFTQLGQVVGTIDYMSPEQAKLNQLDVDTRSDIYSLGVLLYELLTGETPFDRQRLRTAAFDELLRIIREEDPPRPSTRLSTSQSLPSIAANRQMEPKKLSTLVRGELDWIAMKALEKDRDRRYETANALAADLEHYLADEPVVACPPSAGYRFRKFARRNRRTVATAAVIALILLVATLVSTWQAVRATRAFQLEMAARQETDDARTQAEKDRDRAQKAEQLANQERDRAQSAEQRAEANFAKARSAVDEYLTRVTESELLSVPGLQPLRRDLLASASKFYEDFVAEQGDQGDLHLDLAAAHYRLGSIQRELGDTKAASESNARAIDLLETVRQRGEDSAAVQTQLAKACHAAQRYDDTVQLCRELLASDPENVEVSNLLGNAYNGLAIAESHAGRLDGALTWHQQAFAMREQLARRFPTDPKHLNALGSTLNNFGVLLVKQGRRREGLQMYLQAIDSHERAYDLEPSSGQAGRSLAIPLGNAGNLQAALGLDQEALDAYERLVVLRRKLVLDNPSVASLRGDLYQAWQWLGNHQQKLGRATVGQGSFRAGREALENIPRQTADQLFELACVYSRIAQPPESATALSSDQDPAESQRNAKLAIQTLRQALEAGYRDLDTLKTSPDLNPLRDRDEFRQLVVALEKSRQSEQLATIASGTDAEKLESRQRAAALLAELVAEEPENLRYLNMLASTQHAAGVIQAGLKQYAAAEQSLQRALELRDKLLTQHPGKPAAVIDLAEVRLALGRLYWDTARRREAHRLWQQVLLESQQMAAENAEDRTMQVRVASWEREICDRYGSLGLWDLAAVAPRHNAALKRMTNPQGGRVAYMDDTDRAILLAATGEEEAWRQYCQNIADQLEVESPGQPPNMWLVRTGFLLEPAALDAKQYSAAGSEVLQRLETRVSYFEGCVALAHCRAEQFDQAWKTFKDNPLDTSWEADSWETFRLWGGYVFALAAQGRGLSRDALAQLERADVVYQSVCRATLADGRTELAVGFDRTPWELAAAQLLRREAWRKVRDQEPPCEPWWHLVQGRGYRLLGESERADEEFAAAIAAAPDDPDVWLARAAVFEQVGDAARADTDRKKALELAPDDPRCWIRLVEAHVRRGEYEQANAGLAQVQSLHPKSGTELELAEMRAALGLLYWDQEHECEAHRLLQQALRDLHQIALSSPEEPTIQNRVVSREREICRRYGAMGLWDLAATVAEHNATLRRTMGYIDDMDFAVVLAGAGKEEISRKHVEHVVRRWREEHADKPVKKQFIRTSLLFTPPVMDAEECIACASRESENNPQSYFSRFCLALARYRASRHLDALHGIEADPVHTSWDSLSGEGSKLAAAYLYGLAAHDAGRKEVALAQLGRAETLYQNTCKAQLATEREPFSIYFWDLAAAQLLRREAWRKVREQEPPCVPWWHLVQGRGYRLLGESQRAEEEFAAAVAAAPDDPDVWLARAAVFEQVGDAARADTDRKKALELAPDDPRCWIRLVEAYVRRGEYEQANAGLAQVQSLQPKPGTELDLADVRFTLGQAYWDKDRLPEAHQLWQAVLGELHHVALENPEDQALQQRVGTCEREICGRYGAMGLWDLAATVARHNAALRRVTNYTDDADFAVVLAAADGQEAAREYFGHLVRQLGEQHPGDPLNAQQIRTNLLLHPPVIDAEDCIALASNLVEGDPNRYFLQFCLALAQYRASQYAEALKTIESNSLNASWEATSGESNKPGNAYLYALAAQGGDRKEDALAQLERAEGIYQDTCKLQLDGDRKELTEPLCRWFWNLATAQLLRREAWQKIKGQSPPADPWWHLIQARGYGLIGESERAEKELAAAVAAASDAPEVWVARARVFELLGETARAEADRNKAVQVGGGKEAGGVKTPKE